MASPAEPIVRLEGVRHAYRFHPPHLLSGGQKQPRKGEDAHDCLLYRR